MKKILWLAFLTAILSFSFQPALAAEPELTVLYPFINTSLDTLVLNPYFQQSFLDFLGNNSVYTAIDKDGLPVIYFSETERPSLGCSGFCSNITINNYTFGSKSFDHSGLSPSPARTIEDGMVVGGNGIENSIDTLNAIRASLKNDPEALAAFERYLLEQQEGLLRGTYYDERYKDVWDYALSGVREDPALYNSLANDMRMGDMENAIGMMEEYMQNNFDMNGAFDLENLYSAIENGQIGSMQTDEFMRNVLERLAGNENIPLNMDDIDLEKFSDLLKKDEFKEAMKKASEMMQNNPGMFDKLQDLAREMMQNPETRDVLKEALKEMMKEADWDTVKDLMEAFSQMENKQELMKTLMEGMGEYMREMVESGKMDEMMKMMSDPAMKEMMSEASRSFSQEMLESAWDWLKQTPIEVAYVVALIALILTLLILMKLKL